MTPLSASRVNAISTPGRYGDSGGLYLNVSPSGSKSWVQRIIIEGRRGDIGLGGFPAVSLAQPLSGKPVCSRGGQGPYETNLPRWRNGKHTAPWWQTL